MSILSIQSQVSYGHAGNSSAVFPLQTLGYEVWPINTVQFSNHTGYGKWKGEVFPAQHIEELAQGIFEIASYDQCQAILTGYMGNSLIGESILNIVKKLKGKNPNIKYFCDPVMGDVGRGFFVREGIPEYFKESIIKEANHLSPNHFELEYLCTQKLNTYQEVQKACQKFFKLGVESILVTSFIGNETPENMIDILLVEPESLFLVRTPKLEADYTFTPVGTGDLISSLFLGYFLKKNNKRQACERAVAGTYQVIKNTMDKKRKELDIIASRSVFNTESPIEFLGREL